MPALLAKSKLIVPLLFIFGTIFLLYGFFSAYKTVRFLQSAQDAVGTVVGVEKRFYAGIRVNRARSFMPIVEYQTNGGRITSTYTKSSRDAFGLEVGDQVTIKYDTNNPSYFELDNTFVLWGYPLASLAFGVIILIVGVFEYKKWFLKKKATK